MPSCVAKQVTKPIRNREAPVNEPHLESTAMNKTGSPTQGIKTVLHPVSDLATAKAVTEAPRVEATETAMVAPPNMETR